MNVRRTAEEFIKLGCAGIIIEDQVLPNVVIILQKKK